MNIDEIIVKDRIRKDMSDIAELAEDIKRNGLLTPITINTRKELIAGERRYRACKSLGMKDIPIRMATLDTEEQMLEAEISENECRKDFTKTERLEYAKRLQSVEAAKAEQRMKAGKANPVENSSQGKTRDKVAKKLGTSSNTLAREQAIADHKDQIDPEDFKNWDDGKLSTNKVYQDLKKKLGKATKEVENLNGRLDASHDEAKDYRNRLERASRKAVDLQMQLDAGGKVITQKVEVVPKDYNENKNKIIALHKKWMDEMKKSTERQEKIDELESRVKELENQKTEDLKGLPLQAKAVSFSSEMSILKSHFADYLGLSSQITDLPGDSQKQVIKDLYTVETWAQQMHKNIDSALKSNSKKEDQSNG